VGFSDYLEKVDASDRRHADVHEYQVYILSSKEREDLEWVILIEGHVTLGLEHFCEGEADLTFVVDDKDGEAHETMIQYDAIG